MPEQPKTKKLYRMGGSSLGGVCAGIAAYTGAEVGLVRMVAVVCAVLSLGIGGLLYLLLWAVLPEGGNIANTRAVTVDPDEIHSDVYGQVASNASYAYAGSNSDRGAHAALAIGIVLLVVALAFLFSNTLRIFEPAHFWPLVIVAAGIVRMVLPDSEGQRLWPFTSGAGLLVLGLVTLFDSLGLVRVDWTNWLLNGLPLILFAALFYAAGWHWRIWWLKLGGVILMALFFLIGFMLFLGPGPVDQVSMALPMQGGIRHLW